MTENIAFALLCFTSFFSLMNPLGIMPVFITMTSNLEDIDQRRTARKAMVAAFLTLLAFAFSGQLLFNFFGISVNSFRIVGGIIFFQMGADMLQARLGKVKVPKHEIEEYVADISITPLAIPMICGPGCISNAIVLMEDATSVEQKAILIGMISLVCLLTYIILFSSTKISNFLGETGNNVLMRLMGLILMVIAVEFFLSGAKPILADIFPAITAKA
ncbi:MarC family protein [Aureispira sp. CCB-QB1]|uniref:MarC family protein n=1 Tax=Aureispira sp. CCB-QB1 TaxID=1313421 RepID=UPI0006991E77|nr:MarC family protein [Aureispira sp. CCB-QB1]